MSLVEVHSVVIVVDCCFAAAAVFVVDVVVEFDAFLDRVARLGKIASIPRQCS
jgi:hypothetical protein